MHKCLFLQDVKLLFADVVAMVQILTNTSIFWLSLFGMLQIFTILIKRYFLLDGWYINECSFLPNIWRAECHFYYLAVQAKALSELRAHSSSKRTGQQKPKILEENIPKTDKFQPFVKDEVLVSIYNVWDNTSFTSAYLFCYMTELSNPLHFFSG